MGVEIGALLQVLDLERLLAGIVERTHERVDLFDRIEQVREQLFLRAHLRTRRYGLVALDARGYFRGVAIDGWQERAAGHATHHAALRC